MVTTTPPPPPAAPAARRTRRRLAATPAASATGQGRGLRRDRLGPFDAATTIVRWSTTIVCAALAVGAFVEPDLSVVPWVLAVIANTIIRTVTPIEDDGRTHSLVNLLLEVGLHVLAVAGTGYWASPLVLSLVNAITVAGLSRGFAFAVRIGVASACAVTLPDVLDGWSADEFTLAAQWATVLLLVAVVAGYARRISGEASREHSATLQRLDRLADANALLYSLHRIAQTLPASLDTGEVLESTMARLKALLDHHAAAILLVDDTDGSWTVARGHGLRLAPRLTWRDLPPAAARAARDRTVELVGDVPATGTGLAASSGSALYAPLTARGHLVGLLAVEHRDEGHLGARERDILRSFAEPVSLAIDNARWFARLRTVGADEERTRIARDLHDRIGQSLAYLAFELDRIVARDGSGQPVSDQLVALRSDLRTVIGEVRDTLYDLRTDVTDAKDLPTVVREFAGRVTERSGLRVHLDCDGQDRLPLLQERELWRIAQEAVTNVERHAGANSATVAWRCDGTSALLEIADDGVGFPEGTAGRLDSYGILGMRERAASIGASLEIRSTPREGTTVRCYLGHR